MSAPKLIILDESAVINEATFRTAARKVEEERARLLAEDRASWDLLKTLHQELAA